MKMKIFRLLFYFKNCIGNVDKLSCEICETNLSFTIIKLCFSKNMYLHTNPSPIDN